MWLKKSKYGNTKTKDQAGRSFGSLLERSIFDILKLRERAGEIKVIKQQPHITLEPISWNLVPDFECVDMKTGKTFYVEAKGFSGERWLCSKKLWPHFAFCDMEIWMGDWKRPFLKEVLKPDRSKVIEWAAKQQ